MLYTFSTALGDQLRWPQPEAQAPTAETTYDENYWYHFEKDSEIEYYHQDYGWVAAVITSVYARVSSDKSVITKPA